MSLQKCIAIERQHADFWTALAEGYRLLKVTSTDLLQATSSSTVPNQLGDILSNTVLLFRPYFSWRGIVTGPDATRTNQLPITKDESLTNDMSKCKIKPNLAISIENKMDSDRLDLDQSVQICHKNCPFFTFCQSSAGNSHCLYQAVKGDHGTPDFTPCWLHSPFVILASRQVAVEEFIELLKDVTKHKSVELLCSFYTFAECSCYLWAR